MKKIVVFFVFVLTTYSVWAQENSFSLSGGAVFTNLEESDSNANGFRINGCFEFNPSQGNFAHGFAIGYIHTTATGISAEYNLNNVPVYYAPKYYFGGENAKVFIKGALGMHFSGYNRDGNVTGGESSTIDMGLYAGAGAGLHFNITEKVFLNAEYEWNYLSNSLYRDGFVNSVMAGIGFKF